MSSGKRRAVTEDVQLGHSFTYSAVLDVRMNMLPDKRIREKNNMRRCVHEGFEGSPGGPGCSMIRQPPTNKAATNSESFCQNKLRARCKVRRRGLLSAQLNPHAGAIR
eukprot:1150390-Pelagomonas_calceolata.AAC.1